MKNLSKLGGKELEISIVHDLTKEQRDKEKQLVEEAGQTEKLKIIPYTPKQR